MVNNLQAMKSYEALYHGLIDKLVIVSNLLKATNKYWKGHYVVNLNQTGLSLIVFLGYFKWFCLVS